MKESILNLCKLVTVAGSQSLLYRVALVAGQQTQGADTYMSDVYEMLGMTMSTRQQTFWSQRQKSEQMMLNTRKKPTRKRKRSEAIHSSRFETMKQEKMDKKRGRTYESGMAFTMDTQESIQSPAAKKCKNCGHDDHLRGTSALCQYNNSKMLAAPHFECVHETTGNTDFTDESNTCCSSVAGVILQDRDTPVKLEQVSKFNSTNQNM